MENVYKPEEAFALTLTIFKLFGVWPPGFRNQTLSSFHRKFGYGFQIFYIIALIPSQVINMYLNRNHLQQLMDNSFFSLTCIVYVVKLGIFSHRRENIENMFKRLHSPIFAPKNMEHLLVLKNCIFKAKVCALVFFILPQTTCLCWILIPLVDKKKEKVLLFPAWYPFDTNTSPTYGITYAFQIILLLNTAFMNSMMDVLILNFSFVIAGQLEMLKMEFESLANADFENKFHIPFSAFLSKEVRRERKPIPSDSMGILWVDAKDKLRNRFAYSTERYETIRLFVKDITELFQFGIVAQVCASCFTICLTCFKLTLISPKTLEFYVMLQYQACMLIEIFCYTWQGNEITVKTSELKDAVYACAWTSIPNKSFRKSLGIIMSRMQAAIKIRVGGFFPLSLDTFLTILNSAYSFYVLLKQVQQKKNK